MHILRHDADIAEAVSALVRIEPRFATVVETHGPPPLRRMEDGLEGLLRIVTDQLISLKAGEAIWRRLREALHPFDAATIARKRETTLMGLGLSGAKARTFRVLGVAVRDGSLDFGRLHRQPDYMVLEKLTSVTGIGPWTAGIYLLSAMGRADAWPAGDLALQASAQHLFGLGERPGERGMVALAEDWRPWRSVAARLLWSHYRGLKGLSQKIT